MTFVRRLAAVPEVPMRVALWRECFDREPPEIVHGLVALVLTGMRQRDADARLAYQALLAFIDSLRGVEYPPRRALYEAARLAEDMEVCQLFLTAPRARQATEAELRPQAITAGDRELTLGERRALARKPDRASLLKLLYDPDPGVVDNLLRNPYLTEGDVLRVASRRPIAGPSLRAVFRHPRWGRSPAVHEALIYNPYTPTDIALGLLALLDQSTLRAVSHEPSVALAIRARAGVLLRGAPGDPGDPAEP